MSGSDGRLCFSKKGRCRIWIDNIEKVINEENNYDHNIERDAVVGPYVCVCKELVQVLKNKNWKKPWTFKCIIAGDCC